MRPRSPEITESVAIQCRALVHAAALRHGVPPVHITAHISTQRAHAARLEVWRAMIQDLGLRRWQVAEMFGRDLRRVRASVLAPRKPRPRAAAEPSRAPV